MLGRMGKPWKAVEARNVREARMARKAWEANKIRMVRNIEGKIPENPTFVPTPKYGDFRGFHPQNSPKL